MTERGRELTDMMKQRNVDVMYPKETKWKGSKPRNIRGGCKLFYNEANGKKNWRGLVVRKDLVESTLEVKRVSDRLISMTLEVKGSILNIVSAHTPQVGNSMEEKNTDLAIPGWIDKNGITTGENSSRCGLKWTCERRKYRG